MMPLVFQMLNAAAAGSDITVSVDRPVVFRNRNSHLTDNITVEKITIT
jgi:hypothetical protein